MTTCTGHKQTGSIVRKAHFGRHRQTDLSVDERIRCCLAAARPALREVVALALWHAANWFREALNGFAGDPPMATCAYYLLGSFR